MTQRLRARCEPVVCSTLTHHTLLRAGENVRGCYFQFSGRVKGTTAEGGTYFAAVETGDFYTAMVQGPQGNTNNYVSSTTDVKIVDCALVPAYLLAARAGAAHSRLRR
jgi:hypothetical protein